MAKRSRKTAEPVSAPVAPSETQEELEFGNDHLLFDNIKKKLKTFKYKNESQRKLCDLLDKKEITIFYGSAGTGKSHVGIIKALELLCDQTNKYNKIVIIKPIVEAEEKIGFLPGSIEEKTDPFISSVMCLIEKIIGKRRTLKLKERGYIEVKILAYLRGVNIDNSVVIFEEAQNATPLQLKTFLTRIGENTKYFINGDLSQSDRFKNSKDSGLYTVIDKLSDIEEIGFFQFSDKDIVRNPLISKILERLNK